MTKKTITVFRTYAEAGRTAATSCGHCAYNDLPLVCESANCKGGLFQEVVPAIVQEPAPKTPVGDLNSNERGSGARLNSGKPEFPLIPLEILALAMRPNWGPSCAMQELGEFQRTHSAEPLRRLFRSIHNSTTLEETVKVLEYGRKKYKDWNWANGMPWSVPLACASRHLLALERGENVDPESGCLHWGHVASNVMMLLQYIRSYPEGNDLPTMLDPIVPASGELFTGDDVNF